MKIRVPFDDDYVKLLGTAVYLFSYYEWTIIYIVEVLELGFVAEYSRKKSMTSGQVYERFKCALASYAGDHGVKEELRICSREFDGLVHKRNALIHAHPSTDVGGAQILNYQGKPTKPITDMKWTSDQIKRFVEEVDTATCRASDLYRQSQQADR